MYMYRISKPPSNKRLPRLYTGGMLGRIAYKRQASNRRRVPSVDVALCPRVPFCKWAWHFFQSIQIALLLVQWHKKVSFDVSFKLKAVETAEKSKEAAAREFGVDVKQIWEWCSQKDKLVAMIYMYK